MQHAHTQQAVSKRDAKRRSYTAPARIGNQDAPQRAMLHPSSVIAQRDVAGSDRVS